MATTTDEEQLFSSTYCCQKGVTSLSVNCVHMISEKIRMENLFAVSLEKHENGHHQSQ